VVVPGRRPWSRSAWRTQFDGVCAVQPILAAIEAIAAHRDVLRAVLEHHPHGALTHLG
jgi:hypothetical protein